MPPRDSYYRDRQKRSRNRGREKQPDAITASLTVRLLLCMVLLACVWVGGRISQEGGDSFRQSYRTMITEQPDASMGETLSGISGWIQQGWQSAESAVQSLLDRIDGEEATEPESGIQEPQADTPTYQFDYDYLMPQETALTGQGGAFALNSRFFQREGEALDAPPGSVVSPVYLSARMKPPITGPITSSFSWRYHPLSGSSDFHTGMDIAAEEGRIILSVLPGEVVEVGYNDIYGNFIVLQHAENFQTSYSHCSEIIAKEGMKVKKGERIAKVGQTGMVTGPHLHFSVIVDDTFTDPYWTLLPNIREGD